MQLLFYSMDLSKQNIKRKIIMLRHIKIGHKYELTQIEFERKIPEHLLLLKPDTYYLGKGKNRFVLTKHENGEFAGMFQIHIMNNSHFAITFKHDGTFMLMMKYDKDMNVTLCNVDFEEHNNIMEMIMRELHECDSKVMEENMCQSKFILPKRNIHASKKNYKIKVYENEGIQK